MRRPSPRRPRTVGAAATTLALQTGLLVVALLVVVGSLLYVLYGRAAASAADRALRDAVSNGRVLTRTPAGISAYVVDASGRARTAGRLPPGLPDLGEVAAVRRDGRTRQYTVDRDGTGRAYAVRTAAVGGRVVQAVQDREEGEEERERLLRSLVLATGLGVLLAGVVAAWLARRTVDPLTRTVALQRRFVADAGHELRTPLTLLSLRAQMLARRLRAGGDPSSTADAEAVVDDAAALAELLEELLVAADPGHDSDREPVDMVALTAAVVASCDARAGDLGVELAQVDGPSWVEVEGVASSLRRALVALVDNALEHAGERVQVGVRLTGCELHVVVSDDGPGVPADVLPRMFERFASARPPAHPSARRHYGLGLALVADVAAAHGGSIRATSPPDGRGAELDLTLPVLSRAAR